MYRVVIIILAVVLAIAVVLGIIFGINKIHDNWETNNEAEKAPIGRYITIINDTKHIINEVHITVEEGKEIELKNWENPDKTSFPIKIPDEYNKYNEFTVTLIDRYGIKYQKTVPVPQVTVDNKKPMENAKFTEDDYVKQKGDWKRKIDRFFNGD